MEQQLELLQEWVNDCSSLVFFSGSGVSRESGIPDFRRMEADHMQQYQVPPEAILTRAFLERKPAQFFRFYRERILAPLMNVEPNATHYKLTELEKAGKLRMILTQNMDDLHQEAGSKNVTELYGSVMRNDCPLCDQRLSTLDLYEMPGIPYCNVDMCGGVFGPDIFLYGDALSKEMMTEAIYHVLSADLFIVAGTSLDDYPAAAVAFFYDRKKMVLINETPSPLDDRANLVIHAPVSQVMERIQVKPAK